MNEENVNNLFDEEELGETKVFHSKSEEEVDDTDEIMKRISERISEEEKADEEVSEEDFDEIYEEPLPPMPKLKRKRNNKTLSNMLLIMSCVLGVVIIAIGTIYFLSSRPKVEMVDLTERSIDYARNWCVSNQKSINCIIAEDYNENIEKGKLISQSHKAGEVIDKDVRIVYSLGPNPGQQFQIPDYSKMSLSDLKQWFSENKFSNVSFQSVPSELPKDTILSVSVIGLARRDDKITVQVSSGVAPGEDSQQTIDGSSKVVTVPSNLTGISEKEFVNKIDSLGLLASRVKNCNFSTTIEEDAVYDYESGQYTKGDKVNYVLSCGPYKFDDDEFNGLSEAKARQLANDYNDRNAHITLRFVEVTGQNIGRTFDCADEKDGIYDSVTCKLGVSDSGSSGVEDKPVEEPIEVPTVKTVNIENGQFFGKTGSEFESLTRSLGLAPYHDSSKDEYSDSVSEGLVIWHGYGQYEESEGIRYGLSKGAKPQPVEPEPTPVVEKAYLPATNIFESMVYNNADEAEAALRNGVLAKFTNIEYVKTATQDYSAGAIYNVTVNGSTYEPGYFDINTQIAVYISTGY